MSLNITLYNAVTGLQTNQAALQVTSNNVTLDCNHFKLGGLPAGAGTLAIGIASYRDNVTVRHCHVRRLKPA